MPFDYSAPVHELIAQNLRGRDLVSFCVTNKRTWNFCRYAAPRHVRDAYNDAIKETPRIKTYFNDEYWESLFNSTSLFMYFSNPLNLPHANELIEFVQMDRVTPIPILYGTSELHSLTKKIASAHRQRIALQDSMMFNMHRNEFLRYDITLHAVSMLELMEKMRDEVLERAVVQTKNAVGMNLHTKIFESVTDKNHCLAFLRDNTSVSAFFDDSDEVDRVAEIQKFFNRRLTCSRECIKIIERKYVKKLHTAWRRAQQLQKRYEANEQKQKKIRADHRKKMTQILNLFWRMRETILRENKYLSDQSVIINN